MKRIFTMITVLSLLIPVLLPIGNVQAKENELNNFEVNQIYEELADFEFNPTTNNDKVSIIEVIHKDGTISISKYNKETGEVFFDGELVYLNYL